MKSSGINKIGLILSGVILIIFLYLIFGVAKSFSSENYAILLFALVLMFYFIFRIFGNFDGIARKIIGIILGLFSIAAFFYAGPFQIYELIKDEYLSHISEMNIYGIINIVSMVCEAIVFLDFARFFIAPKRKYKLKYGIIVFFFLIVYGLYTGYTATTIIGALSKFTNVPLMIKLIYLLPALIYVALGLAMLSMTEYQLSIENIEEVADYKRGEQVTISVDSLETPDWVKEKKAEMEEMEKNMPSVDEIYTQKKTSVFDLMTPSTESSQESPAPTSVFDQKTNEDENEKPSVPTSVFDRK